MTNLISHQAPETFDLKATEARLKASPNLTLPLDEEVKLLHELEQFELGRFLLKSKGLNGYWTAYLICTTSKHKTSLPLNHGCLPKPRRFSQHVSVSGFLKPSFSHA